MTPTPDSQLSFADEAKDRIKYDSKTGSLYWKKHTRKNRVGLIATHWRGNGYLAICFKAKTYPAHRLIWMMFVGLVPNGFELDHINGIRTDNRIENLRLVTRSENCLNKKVHREGRLPYAHKRKCNGKWTGRMPAVNGVQEIVGTFSTMEEAHEAVISKLNNTKDDNIDGQEKGSANLR